jgi:hypothetical protein
MTEQEYDYEAIEWPLGEDPKEWHYSHRRAWILENEIYANGSIEAVNWSELAEQFGKSKSTLHRDKKRLVEYLGMSVEEEKVRARGRTLFEAILRDVREQYNDPEDSAMTPERVLNIYRTWVKTLREFGQLPPKANDPRHDKDDDATEVPEEISVGISGVEADRFDPDDLDSLPEQDKPAELTADDEPADEQTAEATEQ